MRWREQDVQNWAYIGGKVDVSQYTTSLYILSTRIPLETLTILLSLSPVANLLVAHDLSNFFSRFLGKFQIQNHTLWVRNQGAIIHTLAMVLVRGTFLFLSCSASVQLGSRENCEEKGSGREDFGSVEFSAWFLFVSCVSGTNFWF